MTAVSDRHTSETNRPSPMVGDSEAAPTGIQLSVVGRILIPVVLALLVLAHGCHTGDHDDEPSFGPPVQEMEPPR